MFFRHNKSLQTIAFLLALCLTHGYVLAAVPDSNSPPGKVLPKDPPAGVLNTSDALSVTVNGNTAQDGMTILSGVEIKTNKTGGATITLYRLGKVQLFAETTVKLVFTDGQISLQVVNGQAELTTFKGIEGLLTGADGKVLKTDSSQESSSVRNSGQGDENSTAPAIAAPGLFGLGMLGTMSAVGGVIGGTVLALVTTTKASNTSQGSISHVQP